MSTSQFDTTVILAPPDPGEKQASTQADETPDPRSFVVRGPLEPANPRDVHMFVVIEQTGSDLQTGSDPNDDTSGSAIARGYNLVQGATDRWTVTVTPQNRLAFLPGSAVGTAYIVEQKDDPPGFETYVWTGRLKLTPP